MDSDDFEKEFLRERLRSYRDLLEIAYIIIVDKKNDKEIVRKFESRLLEYGILDKKREGSNSPSQ